jgi:hypothetical protein
MLSKTEQNLKYPIALLLSSQKRKTFESLGIETGVSGDTISRLVSSGAANIEELIEVAKEMFGRKKFYLVIDDTLILKLYSRDIPGTSDNYSSSGRSIERSICSVVAVLTDGDIAIPIEQSIWVSREFKAVDYKKKTELAQELIAQVLRLTNFRIAILDGLFATKEMMRWLNTNKVPFEMRFHSNRVIERNGKRYKIRESPFVALKRGRTRRTVQAFWHGINLHFTALRRQLKNGDFTTVFQVSNFKATAREHVKIYGYRWVIEKFFRTAKQKLGLNDCQSRKLDKQINHIKCVFAAYTIAQFERAQRRYKNVEEAIKSIKERNLKKSNYANERSREVFGYA